MGGTPVFRGTRVPIKNLIDYLISLSPPDLGDLGGSFK